MLNGPTPPRVRYAVTRSILLPLLALLLAAWPATASAQGAAAKNKKKKPQVERFTRRGVYYFRGRVRSPLAGVGTRGAQATNRLALDDGHSRVTIDHRTKKIVFRNTRDDYDDQLVGCILFLAVGTTKSGKKVPAAVHVKIEKDDDDFEVNVHAHLTVREEVVSIDAELFRVVVDNGKKQRVVLTRPEAIRAVRERKPSSRLGQLLTKVENNLEDVKEDPTLPGARVADVSIGIGKGFLSTMALRAKLVSLDGVAKKRSSRGSAAKILGRGAWLLKLTCTSRLLPEETFRRDLFLLGLDKLPMLERLRKKGLKKGESLVFTFRKGKGTIRYRGQTKQINNAPDLVRTYLEFNFLGSILAHQLELRVAAKR